MTGAIIIVTHNNLHLTKRAVSTALAQTVPCYVLVIDNGSTDNTVRWLSSRRRQALDEGGSQCMVVVPERPVSLAACWNLGLDAFFKGPDVARVLVLNNDVEIRPDSFETLAYYMDWSPDHEGLVSMLGVSSRELMEKEKRFEITDLYLDRIPHPDFSAFMISQDAYWKVGPFDEEYFPAYCEDCDMHVRMHREQVKATKIPVPFFHHHSQTLANAGEEERLYIHRMADLNRQRFFSRYGCLPGSADYDRLFL